ncbi:Conserved_hypothetical protein [Hexamita inflata]|uniref:Uncharacterized protein n=1 Tax=Hexamita inflata TaxID=28002 RepID=A0AA86P2B1_9EUKA|nr:Conserved hypothetical protein [Hexamita inflata]
MYIAEIGFSSTTRLIYCGQVGRRFESVQNRSLSRELKANPIQFCQRRSRLIKQLFHTFLENALIIHVQSTLKPKSYDFLIILTMIFSILYFKQLQRDSACISNLLVDNQQYSYCQKSKSLVKVKLQDLHVAHKSNNIQIFMYTDATQQSRIDIEVFNQNVNAFALFGFNLKTNVIKDSLVNISLNFEVFHGALVCIICDVEIYNCSLIFVASGKQLSGLVGEALNSVFLQQSLVQYRLTSLNASGVVNQIRNANANITIVDCKMAGSNLIESGYSGFIACEIVKPMNIIISSFVVCVDNIKSLGNQSFVFSINGTINYSCDVCGVQKVIYGLCGDNLQYAVEHNGMMTCDSPFEYLDNQCKCMYGYLRDGSICVDVIDAIINMSSSIDNNGQIQLLQQNINRIQQQIDNLDNQTQIAMKQIINDINQSFSIMDNNILYNFSSIEDLLDNTTTSFNQYIIDQTQLLNSSTITNQNKLEAYIINNYSQIDLKINNQIIELNDYIQNMSLNIYTLNNTLFNIHTFTNTTITNFNNSINLVNTTIFDVNLSVLQNISIINQSLNASKLLIEQQKLLIQKLQLQISCLNLGEDAKFIGNLCIQKYNISCSDDSLSCNQNIYVSVYDVVSVTNQVSSSSNFSSGYVFSNSKVIKNAFIDVSDGVYSTVQPLFQNQSIFNNIKIQIGTQTVSSGSILTTSSSIVVNLMNIVSKTGCFITVGPSQLNILIQSSSSSNITNLLVNLNFAMSNGNITLINSISGIIQISGYQVLGSYQSTKIVAMIGIDVVSAIANIFLVSFSPNIYCAGSYSSYFYSGATSSTFSIYNISLNFGNITNFQDISSIITTANYQDQYYFGGIVNSVKNCVIVIAQLIIQCYQTLNTDYIQQMGFLIGKIESSQSKLYLQNLCLHQNMTSASLQTIFCGFIGANSGELYLQQSSIHFAVQGLFEQFGIVGIQYEYAMIQNFKISAVIVGQRYIGAIFGQVSNNNTIITNCSVTNSNISYISSVAQAYYIAGFIGNSSSNTTIYNCSLYKTIVQGLYQIGGFFGGSLLNSTIVNSTVNNCSIQGESTIGGFIGDQYDNSTIYNSSVFQGNISGIEQCSGGFIAWQNPSANVTIQSVNITQSIIIGYSGVSSFSGFLQNSSCSIISSIVTLTTVQGYDSVGGFSGFVKSSSVCSILDSTISSVSITGSLQLGGSIGQLTISLCSIKNSNISQTNITGQWAGGFLGYCLQSNLTIQNSQINYVRVNATTKGILVAYVVAAGSSFSFSSSVSVNNYLNGVLSQCANFVNALTPSGC